MLSDAQRFWETIVGKVRWVAEEVSRNTFRCERYEVTTAPNGTKMGVTLPFGSKEISLPYSKEVSTAQVGDQVLVVWWGSMSNAKVYYFANGFAGYSGSSGSPLDAYPIGSYYWSSKSTDPAQLFGGRWERITGVFLLAATDGGSSGASQAAGRTGGDDTHVHTTGNHKLTTTEIPAHSHGTGDDTRQGFLCARTGDNYAITRLNSVPTTGSNNGILRSPNGDISRRAASANTGGGGNHNHGKTGSASNMPPYRSVYCWHRLA